MPITKPLLASAAVLDKIDYPVLASPKLDGIRCLKVNGKVVSRKFKPIRNDHIREILEDILPEGADGEIISGTTFSECSGNVMRVKGTPDFKYYWFDWVYRRNTDESYIKRIERMADYVGKHAGKFYPLVEAVIPVVVNNAEQLDSFEAICLENGLEGIMIRSPEGIYKCGRSTVNEGILLKIKRFADSEGIVTGFVEMMHNENEAKKDAFGRTERSTAKDGKVAAGTLGKLLVMDPKFPDTTIELGTGQGLTHVLRQEIWDNQEDHIGRLVKYKYQEAGMKDKPRFPIYLGFRDQDDMGNE